MQNAVKILHLISRSASSREREQQRLDVLHLDASPVDVFDLATKDLSPDDDVIRAAGLVHVYGPPPFDLLRRARRPWLGSGSPAPSRIPWRKPFFPMEPPEIVGEIGESVDRRWLEHAWHGDPTPPRVASLAGEERSRLRRDALLRLARVRGDVEWVEHRRMPDPEAMARFAAWVDPGASDDGAAVEAMALGMPLIAARTDLSLRRSEDGAAAWLVPCGDANELVHAILSALFKPETIAPRAAHALQSRARFDPERRAAALVELYRKHWR